MGELIKLINQHSQEPNSSFTQTYLQPFQNNTRTGTNWHLIVITYQKIQETKFEPEIVATVIQITLIEKI